MVEDISLIVEAYCRIMEDISTPDKCYIPRIAENCDKGWEELNNNEFDLVILDMNFPETPSSKIKSGEELGQKIRENHPNTKIIVLTGVFERKQLKKVIKKINPEGFLSKGETKSSEIIGCLVTVMAGGRFYGESYFKILGLKQPEVDQNLKV